MSNSLKYFFATMLLFWSYQLFPQMIISGKVVDAKTNLPLAQANIQVINSSIKTISNDSGSFSLVLPKESEIKLKVSYIGYTVHIQEVFPNSKNSQIIIFLKHNASTLPEVFITANRSNYQSLYIPARIGNITSATIEEIPANNTDEILRLIPGVNIDRDFGIFSKNSSISMRGLGSANRSLILLDGIPLNKADGGGVNWNRINPDIIDNIEFIKGPNSSIYGGNAMSGVINIITKKPEKHLEGSIKLFGGTYQTLGTSFHAGGLFSQNSRFYYNLSGFYKSGAGYILQADSLRDSLDVNASVKEFESSVKLGYLLTKNSFIEIEQTFYDDKRSDGFRVFETDGGYYKYTTHSTRISYK